VNMLSLDLRRPRLVSLFFVFFSLYPNPPPPSPTRFTRFNPTESFLAAPSLLYSVYISFHSGYISNIHLIYNHHPKPNFRHSFQSCCFPKITLFLLKLFVIYITIS
jgi:hypothetical protein